MSCAIIDDNNRIIGTFSFSEGNKRERGAWNLLIRCADKYPHPAVFRDNDTHKYAEVINHKVKDNTIGVIHHIVKSVKGKKKRKNEKDGGKEEEKNSKYRLLINLPPTKEKKDSTLITRSEFKEELERFEEKFFKKVELLLKKAIGVPKQ